MSYHSKLVARCAILWFGLVFPVGGAWAGEFPKSSPLTTKHGMVFVDGAFLPPPYRIAVAGEQLTIANTDQQVAIELSDLSDIIDCQLFDWMDLDDPAVHLAPVRVATSDESAVNDLVRHVASQLNDDVILLAFRGIPGHFVARGSDEKAFLEAVLRKHTSEFLNAAPDGASRSAWTRWLEQFAPDRDLRNKLESRLAVLEDIASENATRNSATRRLARFSYPLTVLAMLLAVVSLGHVLKWSAFDMTSMIRHSPAGILESPLTYDHDGGKYVSQALVLMSGMALIDWCWTVLASQAGVMHEVNPLAAGLIHSASGLAVLKVAALAVSFTIFYVLRDRRVVQQAAWWMCLVSVLLTFRWIVVDSLVA